MSIKRKVVGKVKAVKKSDKKRKVVGKIRAVKKSKKQIIPKGRRRNIA